MVNRCSLAALMALTAMVISVSFVAAGQERPIFDTHVHYSRAAWGPSPPETVLEALEAAGVVRALVSSTPDEGTLKLHRLDADRIVPILRPYREGVTASNWFRDPHLLEYISERLRRGIYRGIGEFHLFDESHARTPLIRRLAGMAAERDIALHVHAGALPVHALFAIAPGLKILWAHAGMSEPPAVIGDLLDRYPLLWTDLAFRAADVAPGGRLDAAWRALILRHPDRFMIGTDTYVNGRWEVYGDLIDEHRRWLAQLPPGVADAIAFRNAVRLFGTGKGTGFRD